MILVYIHLIIGIIGFIVARNLFIGEGDWTNKYMLITGILALFPIINIVGLFVVIVLIIEDSGWFDEDGL